MPPQYRLNERKKVIRKIPLIRPGSQWRSTGSMVVCTVDGFKDGIVYATTGVGSAVELGRSFKLTRKLFLECYRPLTREELEELGQQPRS